jgi:DNA (cytosine-5)-methyltransferase 1
MTEPQAISENQRGEIVLTDHMHQLTTGGGKPGQGYPAVIEPLAFHITQDPISSVEACPSLGHKSTGQGIQTATQVRRLTPVECERLMGWPDDHTRWRADGTEVADSHRYRMCGNGVASPVAEWIATQINRAVA